MAVISGTDYRAISDDYGDAYETAQQVKDFLFDAVYKVVLLQVIIPEVDLLQSYWDSYLVNTPIYTSPVNFTAAVKALQSHVLTRGGYATVDAYLAAEGILVQASWADLSADAGYPIGSAYIE